MIDRGVETAGETADAASLATDSSCERSVRGPGCTRRSPGERRALPRGPGGRRRVSLPTDPPTRSAAQQRQDALRSLVGLGEHRGAGLRQDLRAGEAHHLLRHVGVADAALRRGQVLDRDVEVVDGVLEPVLQRTEVRPGGRDRLDRRRRSWSIAAVAPVAA